jgi:hypothetical protein
VLDRLRHRRVHDAAHVAAIDPHTERHRRDHDVQVLAGEGLLRLRPPTGVEPGVVGRGPHASGREHGRERLGIVARDAVHDDRLAGMPPHHLQHLCRLVRAGQDPVHQVRPVERPHQHGRILESELLAHVGPHAWGGGRGERVHADPGQGALELRELAVLGTEVVAPLADAVGLVDHDRPHADRRELLRELRLRHSLRRHEEQPQTAIGERRQHLASLDAAEAAVQGRGGIAVGPQPVDLVLHERDER